MTVSRAVGREGKGRRPTLLTLARRAIVDYALWAPGDRLLCGCSGGADSMALLHVLALLRERSGHELDAIGIDHGLRAEGGAELEMGRELARTLGVRWHEERVMLRAGPNLQARARQARHDALQRVARAVGAKAVALGHTADDRAETLLLRLLRGAGPRGLGVLAPRSPCPVRVEGEADGLPIVRPIILGRRRDVLAHLERHAIDHAEDPSNADRRFLRTRVRLELVPLLEELSPRIVEHLCALAEMMERSAAEPDPWAGLGRAQRLAVEHARRRGRPRVRLRLGQGRDVEIELSDWAGSAGPGAGRSLRGTP